MKHYYRLLFLFLFPIVLFAQPAHNKKVVGYYAQWSIYARDFNVPKIDGIKLTHLNYSFYGTTFDPARPENTKLKSLDTYADFEHTEGGIPWDAPVKGNFYDMKKLKEKYPHLKILISVGGWTKGQDLSPISASPVARAALAADMANFLVTYPFIDGFDIDWEYPLSGGTDGTEVVNGSLVPPQKYSPDDNKNLVYLLKAMRQAMPNKLITIAAGNNVRNVSAQYLGPNNRAQYGMTEDISTYCDYITYFGYDFGGNWYDKTSYNAPLYPSGNTNDPLYNATQSESLDDLTNQYLNVIGFPANKLVMGLPFYGKKFDNVATNSTNGLYVAAPRYVVSGCTNPQNPTGTWDGPAACEKSGSIEICDLVGNPVTNSHPYLDPNTMLVTPTATAAGWVRYWDNTTKVPYLYNAALRQFISYEDKQSIDLKAQYIKTKNLGGGMIWELSQDTRGAIPNALLTQVDDTFRAAVIGTLTVSGSVKNGANLMPSVTVQLKDATNAIVQTVASPDGNYTFNNVVSGANYTVTALKSAYTFTPVILTNITANQANVVINGTQPLYTISGTILDGTTAVAGATVTATAGTIVFSAVSNASGAYSIGSITAGLDYTVTASKTGKTFLPATTVYPVLSDNKVLNFTQTVYYTISGSVMNGATAVSGATVTATSGTATFTSVSSATGAYSVANLPSGANYTVTIAKAGVTFSPASTVYNNLTASKILNFTQNAAPVSKISGTVKNGGNPVVGAKVELIFNWTDNAHPYATFLATTDAQGKYSFDNAIFSGYTIIASLKLNSWQNGEVTYLPSNLTNLNVPATAQVYNFNTTAVTQKNVVLNEKAPVVVTAKKEVQANTSASIATNRELSLMQNAIAADTKISGTVKNGAIPVSGAKVELVVPWTDSTHNWKSVIAITDAQGVFSFDNSVIAGYTTILSLKLNAWENNNITYYPTNLANFAVPTTPQVYNFNTNTVSPPQITITSPSLATIAIAPGTAIQLKAAASVDASLAISSVVFNINGQNSTATLSGTEYVANWVPVAADFNKNYTLKATVTASNGVTAENTKAFYLQCSGTTCPNTLPEVAWVSPVSTTINQASGFQAVPVSVNVTDADGTIASVSISIDGASYTMTKGTGSAYSYTFTPNAYKAYTIIIKATDNLGGETLLNQTITIINSVSTFNPLPAKVIVGYAHGWDNTSAPFLYFNQMGDKKFNVVVYSFIETQNRDGYTPILVVNEPRYMTNGVFNPQLLKNDIKFLRDKGIPVIVSIGGQNGHVELQTVAQKNIFVNGLKAIVDQYNFDGIDIDFEGGSMNFGAGALKDFSYAAITPYPKLKNIVDAFKELKAHYGTGFILTSAPETFYVQVGYSVYSDGAGSFLPVIHNLRNELDLLMVQLYNTGSILALDNAAYSQATPDFLVSMSDMLMKGFNVASTGFYFPPLPASKIVIAIPACAPAAPAGGYLTPEKGIQAFNYLRYGTTYPGRAYTMKSGAQPGMRGVMTWSINWDAACGSGYQFSNAYATYFATQSAKIKAEDKIEVGNTTMMAYFKDNALAISNEESSIDQVEVYNMLGQSILNYKNIQDSNSLLLENRSFTTKQLFIVVVTDKQGRKKTFKVMNFLN
ncbi:T9SS sorting signal type C domain-containing protein [Flavobacterium sp. ALJ2]|uniref:glycosyl hydrolase family 18 protein n=1 Tax=Flavobacterium sp. ALJ2 TaxID=2786960 RepID=UPI00189DC6B4|nr:glycosyl hydrolase family 18 protein [Flavobacterium sp. ALJ2]MBF7092374.1 T9SS sorting signal type C domain-containing protein [Flavobacterium sp. ALJ2]